MEQRRYPSGIPYCDLTARLKYQFLIQRVSYRIVCWIEASATNGGLQIALSRILEQLKSMGAWVRQHFVAVEC